MPDCELCKGRGYYFDDAGYSCPCLCETWTRKDEAMTPDDERAVVREWLEKHQPGAMMPLNRDEYSVGARDYYVALLRAVAPRPKSMKDRVLEMVDQWLRVPSYTSEIRLSRERVENFRAEIAALDDAGEAGKGA